MPSEAEEVRATGIQSEVYQRSMQPLLKKYCFECHKGSSGMAGIRLDQYPTALAAMKDRDTWQQVLQVLQKKEMPPGKAPQSSESEL